MNVIQALRDYVTKIVTDTGGMKVLLMDKDTTGVVSMVYTQSEILAKEVYLVELIDAKKRERMSHLKAVAFLRPTPESVASLAEELKSPKYGEYHIYFSNILEQGSLERLAEADSSEVVREVHEFFGDFYAINDDLFSMNVPRCMTGFSNGGKDEWDPRALERCRAGLASALLSLRKRPVIRYQKGSSLCKKLANDVQNTMDREPSLFDFRRQDTPPVLLILDRRDDPVTPLLTQWTYQAMTHELIGIYNNRVDLSKVAGVRDELREIVLAAEQDEFYSKNMYLNFGEIGASIKNLVDSFQSKTKSNKKIDSIDDMKRFVEEYPQFRAMSGTVSKHVTLVGELSRVVDVNCLLEVSEMEQELACGSDHSSVLQQLREMISKNDRIRDLERLKLVLLYALRYERNSNNDIQGLKTVLRQRGHPDEDLALVQSLLEYAGHNVRSSDLYGTRSITAFAKKTLKGLKGVQNIYTQHQPLLSETLDTLMKGKLKETAFPFVSSSLRDRPQDVIVFIVGGATYEEARAIHTLNQSLTNGRIVLGGSHLHNAKTFLAEVAASTRGAPRRW